MEAKTRLAGKEPMREYRTVPVSDIKIGDRVIRHSDTDVAKLWIDIRDRGLQVPILVDEDLNLIDGLRRINAFGPTDLVDVVVSYDYEETMKIMLKTVGDSLVRPWDLRRVWDFYVATTQQRETHHWNRVREGVKERQRRRSIRHFTEKKGDSSVSRNILARIAGMHAAAIQAGSYVYARAYGYVEEPNPELLDLAKRLVEKMDSGYSPYSARHDYRMAASKFTGSISSESEQRKILKSTSASVTVLTNLFKDFAPINDRITKEEAEAYYQAYMKARTDFLVITKKLKERISRP